MYDLKNAQQLPLYTNAFAAPLCFACFATNETPAKPAPIRAKQSTNRVGAKHSRDDTNNECPILPATLVLTVHSAATAVCFGRRKLCVIFFVASIATSESASRDAYRAAVSNAGKPAKTPTPLLCFFFVGITFPCSLDFFSGRSSGGCLSPAAASTIESKLPDPSATAVPSSALFFFRGAPSTPQSPVGPCKAIAPTVSRSPESNNSRLSFVTASVSSANNASISKSDRSSKSSSFKVSIREGVETEPTRVVSLPPPPLPSRFAPVMPHPMAPTRLRPGAPRSVATHRRNKAPRKTFGRAEGFGFRFSVLFFFPFFYRMLHRRFTHTHLPPLPSSPPHPPLCPCPAIAAPLTTTPFARLHFLNKNAISSLRYGRVAKHVAAFSGCSSHSLCATPFSVSFSARVRSCVSFFTSSTTLCMSSILSGAQYVTVSGCSLNSHTAATEACAACAQMEPSGHPKDNPKSLRSTTYCTKFDSAALEDMARCVAVAMCDVRCLYFASETRAVDEAPDPVFVPTSCRRTTPLFVEVHTKRVEQTNTSRWAVDGRIDERRGRWEVRGKTAVGLRGSRTKPRVPSCLYRLAHDLSRALRRAAKSALLGVEPTTFRSARPEIKKRTKNGDVHEIRQTCVTPCTQVGPPMKPHTEALVSGNLGRVLRERFVGEDALLEAAAEMLVLDVLEGDGVPENQDVARARWEQTMVDLEVTPLDEDDIQQSYSLLLQAVHDALANEINPEDVLADDACEMCERVMPLTRHHLVRISNLPLSAD